MICERDLIRLTELENKHKRTQFEEYEYNQLMEQVHDN